jgi:Zn-finger nucleic acid-binding protein
MRQVSARANPGTLIVLDQCGKCGGIWCDKWELFPIDPDEAPRLDPLDEKRLQAPVALKKQTLYCPRCRDRLQLFREPLLPPGVQLQRCRRCEGIWLKKGQLSRYKRFQGKRKEKNLGPKKRLQQLAQAYDNPRSWVTIGTRGIFAYPRGAAETDEWPSVTLGGAFRLIFQALLRMVL